MGEDEMSEVGWRLAGGTFLEKSREVGCGVRVSTKESQTSMWLDPSDCTTTGVYLMR